MNMIAGLKLLTSSRRQSISLISPLQFHDIIRTLDPLDDDGDEVDTFDAGRLVLDIGGLVLESSSTLVILGLDEDGLDETGCILDDVLR